MKTTVPADKLHRGDLLYDADHTSLLGPILEINQSPDVVRVRVSEPGILEIAPATVCLIEAPDSTFPRGDAHA